MLLLPFCLVLAYIFGALAPPARTRWFFEEADRASDQIMPRCLRRLWILRRKREWSSTKSLVEKLFLELSARDFGFAGRTARLEKELDATRLELDAMLLDLGNAKVLSGAQNLWQLDIERHYVLKSFYAKTCALFALTSVTLLVGFLSWGLLTASWCGWTFCWLVACYAVAWSTGRKAENNHEHWREMVMQAYVAVSAATRMTEEPSRAEDRPAGWLAKLALQLVRTALASSPRASSTRARSPRSACSSSPAPAGPRS